jgi:biopolymer transport protein ExbB
MLGLFGTVYGMIQAFNEITRKGATVTPQDLSAGISTALITTLFGLFVAMPALFFFFLFRNKVIKVSLEITAIAADLVERFRPQAS